MNCEYRIAEYEVTAGQYAAFLNAVSKTDTCGLHNPYMDYDAFPDRLGCNIKRSGSPGSYTCSVAPDWVNRPVNWVSWGDAARFANWLHNGQPTGAQDLSTTEDGAWHLNVATSYAAMMAAIRKPGAKGAAGTTDILNHKVTKAQRRPRGRDPGRAARGAAGRPIPPVRLDADQGRRRLGIRVLALDLDATHGKGIGCTESGHRTPL